MQQTQSLRQNSLPYTAHLAGIALLGLVFPEMGTFFCAAHTGDFSLRGIIASQLTNPILWLLDFVPAALVVTAWRSPAETAPSIPDMEESDVVSLTSRIEELEREIGQRDLRLEEVGFLLDVSSHVRQSLLEAIGEPCFVLDCDGKITDANEAFWKLTFASTNPNLSFYADQLLDVKINQPIQDSSSNDLSIGILKQEDVRRVSFRAKQDSSAFTCQVRALGENGGPIGSLWILTLAENDPEPSGETSVLVDTYEPESPTAEIVVDPTIDGLTGFQNLDRFRERLDEEYAHALHSQLPLSLLLIDLENFRLFNHRYGKTAGDEALVSVAASIKSCVRASDCIARYAGDVFAVLLPSTDRDVTVAISERLRKIIELKSESGPPISVHIACTTLEKGQKLVAFGESAGRALAHAKTIRNTKIVHSADLLD